MGAAAAAGGDLPRLRPTGRPGALRIGRWLQSPMPDIELDPRGDGRRSRTRRGCSRTSGTTCDDVPPDLLGPDVLPSFEGVWALSGTTLPVPPERVGELRPLTRELRGRGLAMSAQAAMEAMLALRLFSRRFLQATAEFDVLLAPVTTMTPRPLGWFDADGDGAADFERQKRYAAFTALFNVTGQPAVSVPLHWTPERTARRQHARRAPGGRGDAARAVRLSWRRRGPGRTCTPRRGSRTGDRRPVPVGCRP